MAQGDIIAQGSDQTLTLALTDADGAALDISAAQAVAVYLLQGKQKVVARYCTETISTDGFINDKLSVLSGAGGTLELLLDRAVTAGMELGALYYKAEVQTANADFEDSRANVESSEPAYVAEVVKGVTKQLDLNG
jgi:hypothetical protein